jgi:hypothetical protein
MSTILAIEPDRRRAAQLTGMARAHLRAELLVAPTAAQAVEALDGRVPDVLLTAPLLPSHEETVIADYLRQLGPAAAHVQTLTIPLLAGPGGDRDRPVLSAFRRGRGRAQPTEAEGCDPAVFAEQITEYLREARDRRSVQQHIPVAAPVDAVAAPVAIEESEPQAAPETPSTTNRQSIKELLAKFFDDVVDGDESNDAASAFQEDAARRVAEVVVEPAEVFDTPDPTPIVTYELQHPRVVKVTAPVVTEDPLPVLAPASSAPKVIAIPVVPDRAPAGVDVAVSVNLARPVLPPSSLQRRHKSQPVQDAWGFFDPNQCGFPALIAKLDEIASRESDG